MKEKKRSGLSKEYRQLRGWFLLTKMAVLLPSLALGTHDLFYTHRPANKETVVRDILVSRSTYWHEMPPSLRGEKGYTVKKEITRLLDFFFTNLPWTGIWQIIPGQGEFGR